MKNNPKKIQKEIDRWEKELKEIEFHYKNKTILDGELMLNECEFLGQKDDIEFKIKELENLLKDID